MHNHKLFPPSSIIVIASIVIITSGNPVERLTGSEIELNNNTSPAPTALAIPVQNFNQTEVGPQPNPVNETAVLLELLMQIRQRQEEGGGGLENVAEIIQGALGGGLGNIFSGSSSFIGDSGVQEEVQFVLNNVSPVFDTLLKYGWQGLKQYFGFGVTPRPVPTPRPMLHLTRPTQLVHQASNQTLQSSVRIPAVQPQPVTAPTTEEPTTPNEDDEDNIKVEVANVLRSNESVIISNYLKEQ